MESCDTKSGARFHRVVLTDEELQLSSIEYICDKYNKWLMKSKDKIGGRVTRAQRNANGGADEFFEEIMAYKLPPIQVRPVSPIRLNDSAKCNGLKSHKDAGDDDSSSVGSATQTRTLRPRSRAQSGNSTPSGVCTPKHQNIRTHLKRNPGTGTSVLSAAINQQHPSVSAHKIRQILRADSVQKKIEEERERQERLRLDRKVKEERAEAQKKQMLEERAIAAKTKREQRLLHAAEVRKAREKTREETKLALKLNEEQQQKKAQNQAQPTTTPEPVEPKHTKQKVRQQPEPQPQITQAAPQVEQKQEQHQQQSQSQLPPPSQPQQQNCPSQLNQVGKLDETFKKPSSDQNNIDISVHDETTDSHKSKGAQVATWAKAPHLREAIIAQYSKTDSELLKKAREIFSTVKLPVDLNKIFGPGKAVNNRYLCRTSSAVWSPPNRALKRTSSMVLTPNESKR